MEHSRVSPNGDDALAVDVSIGPSGARSVYVDEFARHPRGREIFRKAITSRLVEEALLDLFSTGKLNGTVHTCIGQELTGAVVTEFLEPGDTIFSNHRCHGHFLSRNDDIEGLIAELMGRSTGVCGGLGGSQHLCKDGFFSNGLQGGIVPVAAGLAMAHKLKAAGAISVVFIGDGTLGEGAVYETMNIAAKWQLPLLIVLEDNGYSQSTSQPETLAGEILARPAAFGIEHGRADTWDWPRLYDVAGGMIRAMRTDGRPRFLQIETSRLKAHSKGDDTRARHIVEPLELRDPLNRHLLAMPPGDAAIVRSIKERIEQAERAADAAAPASLVPMSGVSERAPAWSAAPAADRRRFVTRLTATFEQLMRETDEVVLVGEDVLSPYGGAFKASAGLSDLFPGRVYNTPISEAAIVGIGAGLGLAGYHPVVEIMFGDFVGLAFDQIVNHAAKFHQMYNGQVSCNLIVRTPMGGGRGYGPTHSQTLDRHFLGVPGLRVVALNALTDPARVYGPLVGADSGPTLVLENKLLYGSYVPVDVPSGFELLTSGESAPSGWLRPQSEGCDVTLLGYGGTAEMLIRAADRLFEEHDVLAQVLAVGQIYPFSVQPFADILRRAGRVMIVEEGQGFAGFGAECIGQMSEDETLRSIRPRRLAPPMHCIPSSGVLERAFLPSVESIVAAVTGWVRS